MAEIIKEYPNIDIQTPPGLQVILPNLLNLTFPKIKNQLFHVCLYDNLGVRMMTKYSCFQRSLSIYLSISVPLASQSSKYQKESKTHKVYLLSCISLIL